MLLHHHSQELAEYRENKSYSQWGDIPQSVLFLFLFHALKTGRQNCCISAFVDSTESSGGNWIKQKNPALTVSCILSNSELPYPVTENKALGPKQSLLKYLQYQIQYSSVELTTQKRAYSVAPRFPFNEHKYQSLPPPENSKIVLLICFEKVFLKAKVEICRAFSFLH